MKECVRGSDEDGSREMVPVWCKGGVCYLSFHGCCQPERPNAFMLSHRGQTAVIRETA